MPLNEKADLMKIYQEELKRGITMQPVVKEKNEFYVVGIELTTEHGSCRQDVPKFWRSFSHKDTLLTLSNLKNCREIFGICAGSCQGRCGDPDFPMAAQCGADFGYLICSEVENLDDIPDGFVSRTIPKAKYAVFTIDGGFPKIQKGMESIYKNWLLNTSYELADSPGFERYDEDWTGNNDSKMEIWIPVK